MLNAASELATPLIVQLGIFARWLTWIILAVSAATFAFGTLLREYTASEMFLAAVGLAVAVTPEGLPAIVTITLAIGVQRMASRNAIIRRFSLSSTSCREVINARLTGIRDLRLLFCFIDLGAKLDFSALGGELWPAMVLSFYALIANLLIVMAIMGDMGFCGRTGFLAGLTVAQISELLIVFVAMGIGLGHMGVETLDLTTLAGHVTITLSIYVTLYSQPLYQWFASVPGVLERGRPHGESNRAFLFALK